MNRFNAMTVLLAVVEEGSLSAAARRLRMPLPTVSRKVADLEAFLGTRILVRTSRRVSLTDAGARYLASARNILEQVEEAERRAAGEYREPRGELVVTAPGPLGRLHVVPVTLDFLDRHPRVDIRMMLSERNVSLADEHVHLAIRVGRFDASGLAVVPVGQVRPVACASPAYLARRGTPERPEDLSLHDVVTLTGFGGVPAWTFGVGQRAIRVEPRSRLTVNTAEAALQAAVDGVGITRVQSYQATQELGAGILRRVLEAHEPEPVPVSAVHRDQRPVPLKLQAYLDWCVPRLRERLA
jgi:DNA-binding transcriptional LysR family regulator